MSRPRAADQNWPPTPGGPAAEPVALRAAFSGCGPASLALAQHLLGDPVLAADTLRAAFTLWWKETGTGQPALGYVDLLGRVHRAASRAARDQDRAGALDRTERPRRARAVPDSRLFRQRVRRSLARLADRERQCVLGAYFGASTQQQIAQATGRPLEEIRAATLAAMTALHRELTRAGPAPG